MRRKGLVTALALLALAAAPASATAKRFDVLVFSKTAGFRHDSIPAGIAAIRSLGSGHGFRVVATEDASAFTTRKLRRFEAVVFLNTTGTVLGAPQRRALERHVRRGGGFVGVHAAADTEYAWPFYGRLVGARFKSHPAPRTATIDNEAPGHPATAHLPERFEAYDELYSFRTDPRPRVRVLLSIDHPMSWCRDIARGRTFYTAFGHVADLYAMRWYRRHLLGGIRTAARAVKADCSPR